MSFSNCYFSHFSLLFDPTNWFLRRTVESQSARLAIQPAPQLTPRFTGVQSFKSPLLVEIFVWEQQTCQFWAPSSAECLPWSPSQPAICRRFDSWIPPVTWRQCCRADILLPWHPHQPICPWPGPWSCQLDRGWLWPPPSPRGCGDGRSCHNRGPSCLLCSLAHECLRGGPVPLVLFPLHLWGWRSTWGWTT